LLKAITRLGYTRPTLVQSQVVPLALSGKDLLIRAATGSGKTAAYGLVLLQQLIARKTSSRGGGGGGDAAGGVASLVLVPTRELVDQTQGVLAALSHYCTDLVTITSMGGSKDSTTSAAAWASTTSAKGLGDVLVATPSRAARASKGGGSAFAGCKLLVIDEADLCLSYGHEGDVVSLVGALPRGFQALMLSATLSPALEGLKRLVLHAPGIVKLEEGPGGEEGGLTQFYLRTPSDDKFLALVALFRLRLISGRTLVFTNSIDACYRLKLLLDKFGIASATLNAELPVRSRASVIEQFNRGLFEILLATDEALGEEEDREEAMAPPSKPGPTGGAPAKRHRDEGTAAGAAAAPAAVAESAAGVKGRKRVRIAEEVEERLPHGGDGEEEALAAQQGEGASFIPSAPSSELADPHFGSARGLDFKGVTTVVNFDFPLTASSYHHRIGRTARGGASGVALSLLSNPGIDPKADKRLAKLQARAVASQPSSSSSSSSAEPAAGAISPLPFDLSEIEGFRYRVRDVIKALTPAAVREARMEELRREALASTALSAYWEDHPADKLLLAHARPLGKGKRGGAHLKEVPTYLLPVALRAALEEVGAGPGTAKNRGGGSGGAKGRQGKKGGAGKQQQQAQRREAPIAPPAAGGAGLPQLRLAGAGERGGGGGGMKGGRGGVDPLRAFALNAGRNEKAGIGRKP